MKNMKSVQWRWWGVCVCTLDYDIKYIFILTHKVFEK